MWALFAKRWKTASSTTGTAATKTEAYSKITLLSGCDTG
jgi:hypothetical protein